MMTMRMAILRVSLYSALILAGMVLGCSESDPIPGNGSPVPENTVTQPAHVLHMAASADEFDPAFPVKPALELEEWVHDFEDTVSYEKQSARLKESEAQCLELKRNGRQLWNSQQWMKEPSYYRALDTSKLAEECFGRSVIAFELTKYTDPAFGLQCVRIMHNGFAELFSRTDLWQGVLHALDRASATIAAPASDMTQLVQAVGSIEAICTLCRLSPLREQVKGHEAAFLQAQIRVLKRFRAKLDLPRADGSIGFFREPCSVVNMAMVFLKQIAPTEYAAIAPRIGLVRFPREQNADDLKAYLDMVIPALDSASEVLAGSKCR